MEVHTSCFWSSVVLVQQHVQYCKSFIITIITFIITVDQLSSGTSSCSTCSATFSSLSHTSLNCFHSSGFCSTHSLPVSSRTSARSSPDAGCPRSPPSTTCSTGSTSRSSGSPPSLSSRPSTCYMVQHAHQPQQADDQILYVVLHRGLIGRL